MKQVWLAGNRRIWTVVLVAATILSIAGSFGIIRSSRNSAVFFLAFFVLIVGAWFLFKSLAGIFTPRLAYQNGELLVYLSSLAPIRIPIKIVEVFFLGQGGSRLSARGNELENSTIVVRIAEAAEDWQRREVNTKLGHWCEGYITIRGAWCEPLNVDVIRRLNQNLIQAKKKSPSSSLNATVDGLPS